MNLELFLREDKYVDYSSQNIIKKSIELFKDTHSVNDKVKIVFDFIQNEIPHSGTVPNAMVTTSASSVLEYKTGIYHSKANLFAALLRAQNIPTGFYYQYVTFAEDDSEGYALHCFNAIYINNNWLKLDANDKTQGENNQFYIDKPYFAFKNRPEYNEYSFDGIWATSDNKVMNILQNAKHFGDVFNGFPEFPDIKPEILLKI
jgi:hypothetical protein